MLGALRALCSLRMGNGGSEPIEALMEDQVSHRAPPLLCTFAPLAFYRPIDIIMMDNQRCPSLQ